MTPSGDCTFCRIVTGDLPATIVAETELTVAFLDYRPLFPGHTLVIPRAHIETLREVDDELIAPFFAQVKRLTAAVQDGMGAQGTFVAENNVVSQSVAHLHLHVVPRTKGDGLRGFFWPRVRYASDEEREEHRARIAGALAS